MAMLRVFHLLAKVVNWQMFCCFYTNQLPTYQIISGYVLLQQAWAYWRHYFYKSFTSLKQH